MLEIKNMDINDLNQALLWAKEEGWNVGNYDAEAYLRQDNKGFKMLYLNGKAIGCISVVKYTEKFGFIGLFIVKKEHRNKGYGSFLFKSELKTLKERLESNSMVGLYAVPAKISTYQKLGFSCSYKTNKFFIQKRNTNSTILRTNNFFQSISQNDVEDIASYESAVDYLSRKNLLTSILQQKFAKGFYYIENNKIQGFGILRKCNLGYRLGPLYADNLECAKGLFEEFIKFIPNDEKIFLDMPDYNKFSAIFADYFRLENIQNEQIQAMLDNLSLEETKQNKEKKYAICSLELS